ncbi:MAG TPA: HEPN domain-containing protein [Planctomycetota bacterium]|nr:HEPN domain-containing protein [Planctomycetota bacterium]HRR78910.1 HEPN domain-containing protein [Planctomycetota bacterium]HRT92812.1 HEPN domain-containing protein [Planctomycetota bacterium]
MNDHTQALIQYRLEQAARAIRSAESLIDCGDLPGSVNRSYYAMFYSVLALLARQGMGASKHTEVIALFSREFIKRGVFPVQLGRWMRAAFDLRLRADYRELFQVTLDHAREALAHAREFLAAVRQELEGK